MDCIFCKIIKKELPAEIVAEEEKVVAFKDIKPVAPIHILIVPKKHIPSINEVEEKDKELLGEMLIFAKKVAEKYSLTEKGYKLVFNVGKGGGQIIFHLHLHLIGGWEKEKERKIPNMP